LPPLVANAGNNEALAPAAVDAPVPPSATAKSVIPVIEPPVIETELDAWVAIEPKPRLVLASAAVDPPVPPSAIARSVMPEIDPPVIDTLLAACVAIVPSPRFVLAVETEATSDKLFDAERNPVPDTYAATQADPVYTRISPATELKYRAPPTRALPSLSNVGLDVLDPR
jgi:hypothetical protein